MSTEQEAAQPQRSVTVEDAKKLIEDGARMMREGKCGWAVGAASSEPQHIVGDAGGEDYWTKSEPPQEVLPCGCTIEKDDKMNSSIFWNEFNRVVQCHKCGHVYEPKQYPASSEPQEWTATTVRGLRRLKGTHNSDELIAIAHNAALAAERQRNFDAEKKLRDDAYALLAAEREKRKPLVEALEWLDRRGGLGLEAHALIAAALAKAKGEGV